MAPKKRKNERQMTPISLGFGGANELKISETHPAIKIAIDKPKTVSIFLAY
jgi:hypothetical protein